MVRDRVVAVLDGCARTELGCHCKFISRKFTAGFGLKEVVQWCVNLDPLVKTRLSALAVRTCCLSHFSLFCCG